VGGFDWFVFEKLGEAGGILISGAIGGITDSRGKVERGVDLSCDWLVNRHGGGGIYLGG
jgi:hypothetical protein